jgi:hypothetical protein
VGQTVDSALCLNCATFISRGDHSHRTSSTVTFVMTACLIEPIDTPWLPMHVTFLTSTEPPNEFAGHGCPWLSDCGGAVWPECEATIDTQSSPFDITQFSMDWSEPPPISMPSVLGAVVCGASTRTPSTRTPTESMSRILKSGEFKKC